MTKSQERTNKQRGREDLYQTGGIGAIILAVVELVRSFEFSASWPWPVIMTLVVALIAWISSMLTKRKHRERTTVPSGEEE